MWCLLVGNKGHAINLDELFITPKKQDKRLYIAFFKGKDCCCHLLLFSFSYREGERKKKKEGGFAG